MAGIPKLGASSMNAEMHYTVGAIIERDGRYLLIERANIPFGFAAIAGHIDEGEEAINALPREVREESGLSVVGFKLLCEEELPNNICSRGIQCHYWYLFSCEVEGEVERNEKETLSIGWYTPAEIANIELEPAWKYWFERMGII